MVRSVDFYCQDAQPLVCPTLCDRLGVLSDSSIWLSDRNMGKKAAKATRKFASSGQLKKAIQSRRKQRDIKLKTEKRKANKGKGKARQDEEREDDVDDGEETSEK